MTRQADVGEVGREYRGLLLDFNGVLTSDLFAAYRQFCEAEGLAPNSLFDLLTSDPQGHELLMQIERGRIEQTGFEAAVGQRLGVNGTGMIERICGWLQPEDSLLGFAAELRQAGVRTGVLSNSLGIEPFNPYQPWQLAQRFDVVVLSGEVGIRKPEPEIFLLAIKGLGVEAAQCVFVDDMEHNLPPAEALGLTTLLHTDAESTTRALRQLFDHVLRVGG